MKPPILNKASPTDLDDVVAALVRNPADILIWTGLDRHPRPADQTRPRFWADILLQARQHELRKAPPAIEYAPTGGGWTATVLGFGFLTTPLGVPALISMALTAIGSATTLFDSLVGCVSSDRISDRWSDWPPSNRPAPCWTTIFRSAIAAPRPRRISGAMPNGVRSQDRSRAGVPRPARVVQPFSRRILPAR